MIEVNKEGQPILKLFHLRAGHWPGRKNPPWGVCESAMAELQERFNVVLADTSSLPAVIETVNRRVVVTLKQRSDKMDFFAHPTDPEKWILDE